MNDNEREMDLALAEAEQENRLLRARNERLERELAGQVALNKMAENARELGLDYEPAPVQDLPFGVGGGLVAIKTLLGRDPCVHANTAIEMIDAILKEHPAAQPAVQEGRDWSLLEATQESLREHMAEIVRLKAAQNPWVNLTDKEMEDLWAIHSGLPLYRAIEAKLREKNT
jgi:hypothetical protein